MAYPAETRTLTIGYLHLGLCGHGTYRYGHKMAQEAARRSDVRIIERELLLTDNVLVDYQLLRDAAKAFASADLVHIQISIWSSGTWGTGFRALANLAAFRRMCPAPLVVTLHDLNSGFTPLSLRAVITELLKGPFRPAIRAIRGRRPLVRPLWDFGAFTPFLLARWAAVHARAVFVLTGVEKKVLETLGITDAAIHIPHFVEPLTPNPAGSDGKTVVVAGHFFESKGHELVIEALALAPSIRAVFVGGNKLGDACRQVMDLARVKGVSDRLTATGYLLDDEYTQQLAAGDLGVCAFAPNKSASGSLAALIAADCPILASDIPVVAEYEDLVPGAVHTFSPLSAEALAGRIQELLAAPRQELTKGLGALRERLSIARAVDRHLDKYRLVVAPAAQPVLQLGRLQ